MNIKFIDPSVVIQWAGNIAILLSGLGYTYYLMKTKLKDIGGTSEIPKKVTKQSAIDFEIFNRLDQDKERLNADRIQVYEFHNGGHYANGRSALKTTCTYESVRSGNKSFISQMSCIPLGCIPNFINELLTKYTVEVQDIETIKSVMPSTYSLQKTMGVKSFYSTIICNGEGDPVGFVSIQFTKNAYNNDQVLVNKLVGFIEDKLISSLK